MTPSRTHKAAAVWIGLALICCEAGAGMAGEPIAAAKEAAHGPVAPHHRVLVSTDIGGSDPDDFQSMVHLLVYADAFDLEGLISSPFDAGAGRTRHILEVINCYERDYANLRTHSPRYPTPDALRAITKQGETEVVPYAGVRQATEGSNWIVECARRNDPRPLHILVWGGIQDLAQALHDAPDILPKLRVYYIGGPNKKWGPHAFQYLAEHHPSLWIIENNSSYRGWFTGGNQEGDLGNERFVARHVAEHGALGDFFVSKKADIKMGDTPSVAWLLSGTPSDPSQPGWGGRFVRAWKRPYSRFDRLTTTEYRMEVFGILELILPLGDSAPADPQAQLLVENQSLAGQVADDGTIRFRFCPKTAQTYGFTLQSNVPSLDGKGGGITAILPAPDLAHHPSANLPNWWTDDPSPEYAEGPHAGAKTVSRWREEFLRDFAARMDRCRTPAVTDAGSGPRAGVPGAKGPPAANVQPLKLDAVRWTRGFWADRFAVCAGQTVPGMWRLMSGTNYSQYLENFRIAAGMKEGRYRGAPFNDGDFYKWIEAACLVFGTTGDAPLRSAIDESVTTIAQAQRSDGYLHTPVLVHALRGEPGGTPFEDRNNFELYNLGHLMTAACVHHQVTGESRLLDVACRAADFLETTFRSSPPDAARSSVCPSHFMGLVDLHRETGEPRYLALANQLFAMRSEISDGGDDNQDRIPFGEQTEAVGHAVRGNYLYAGATDLFMETGDTSLWSPIESVWRNLTERKLHLTGGCGALYDGASPDASRQQRSITRVHQAYGRNYQLPNVTAHNETCANIGNVLWNWRMFLATGESRFIDVLELALYNSVLSGVSLGGTNFFYTNPLRVTDPLPTELRWSRTRVPYVSAFCCPPNLARTIAGSSRYAYARSPGTLWVNLYGASTVSTTLDGVGHVRLSQVTEYPWNGRVRLKVEESQGAEFAIRLRIPGWAKSAALRVNLRPVELDPGPDGYVTLRRRWLPGDLIDLDLPMEPRLLESHPLVEETFNQLAVKHGPLVYCLESADLPTGTRILDVALPPGTRLTARYDGRLLQGVVVLEGDGQLRPSGDWSGQLYREVAPTPAKPIPILLVPYYAWANRAPGEMTVWMPRAR
ncbi:MAG: glycoside hydrolase family 127 protein [Verrucomicrobiales bacterium]|nr:glycoside hydrolase family 127 protein [Verrucomicrobiales bacterium]